MSNSVRPHRRQPSRLPRPWDSPGKNTGVGCHFLLQCMKVKSESEVAQLCPTLSNRVDCRLPCSSIHGIFQARVLEWGAIAFSETVTNGSEICVHFTIHSFPQAIFSGWLPSLLSLHQPLTEWMNPGEGPPFCEHEGKSILIVAHLCRRGLAFQIQPPLAASSPGKPSLLKAQST